MLFLLFLHDDRRIRIQSRIRIRIHIYDQWIWIRIREAQKHVDPVDPDPGPEHWFLPKVRKVFVHCAGYLFFFIEVPQK